MPFHLLTKEFYTLLKQRLTPSGAAAFNVHDGTKLYASTVMTLAACFPSVHLYPSGEGEVIAVVTGSPAPDERDAGEARRGAAGAPQFPLSAAAASGAAPDAQAVDAEGRAAHRRFRAGQSLRHDGRTPAAGRK